MPYRIRIVGTGTPTEQRWPGWYWLAAADADANGGRGQVRLTTLRAGALTFPSVRKARQFWRQPSTQHPLTPDGRPNRPLTEYTIEIVGDRP